MNMILSRSPYYLNIPFVSPLTSATCSEYTIKLYYWSGDKNSPPTESNYEITRKNYETSTGNDSVNIGIISDGFVIDVNSAWCKSEVYYKTTDAGDDGVAQLAATDLVLHGFAYGYEETNLSVPADSILMDGDIFKVGRSTQFLIPVYADFTGDAQIDSYPLGEYSDTQSITYSDDSDSIIQYITVDCSQTTEELYIDIVVNGKTISLFLDNDSRYTMHDVKFINKYGVNQVMTFRKEKTESISITRESFEASAGLAANGFHQFKDFNVTGKTRVTLSSGYIEEENNEVIKQLVLSDKVYIEDVPANIKATSVAYKTQQNERLVDYQLEFEYSYNEINSF